MIFPSKLKRSFSLIEVLLVVALLGILSSAVIIAINPTVRGAQARDSVRKTDLGIIYNALVAYFTDHGTLPYVGDDYAVGSSEEFWLNELKNDYLKTIPKDPRQAGILFRIASVFRGDFFSRPGDDVGGDVAAVTVPDKSKTYQMKVLVINYMPPAGSNLNSSITGITSTISAMRSKVNTIKNETLTALENGSKYHGTGPVAMDYSIIAEREYLQALPQGLSIGGGKYRPDYMQILNRENICDYVDNQGLKEVWLFGYHHGPIEPTESNMSGPNGDISNSERTNDMPVCSKTYLLYNYNYGRTSDQAVHNHGHQIEIVMKHFGDPLFEDRFIGPFTTYGSNNGAGSTFHRCGWTHTPPNTSGDYDYTNARYSWTDCEDWKPDGSGVKVNINCNRWQCIERNYHAWRWQGMPGKDNTIPGVTNWWDFIGDIDAVIASGQKLIYDVTPPSAASGLVASNVSADRVTLNWTAATDDYGVAGYQIKRGGVVVGASGTTTFVDYGVVGGTQYEYTVVAVDGEGNTSADSNVVSVTTGTTTSGDPTRPVLDASTSKNGGPSAKTFSFSHSIGNGPNRYLVVAIGNRNSNSNFVSTVKYNGLDLTRVGFRNNGGLRVEIWGLLNPPSGIGDITVDMDKLPAGGATMAAATSWAYVNQATPTGTFAGSVGSSNNPNILVPSTTSSVVVDVGVMPSRVPVGTAGSGQTVVLNLLSPGDTAVMSSYKDGATPSTMMSWNTHVEGWAMGGISINLGLPDPIIIIVDPPVTPTPVPSATPEPEVVGCPESTGNYCYVVDNDLKGFTLWSWLENGQDSQIWNKPGAKCSQTPPKPEYYNYCLKY